MMQSGQWAAGTVVNSHADIWVRLDISTLSSLSHCPATYLSLTRQIGKLRAVIITCCLLAQPLTLKKVNSSSQCFTFTFVMKLHFERRIKTMVATLHSSVRKEKCCLLVCYNTPVTH